MLGDVYREPYDGAAAEVDDVVDGDHLQVQDDVLGALQGPGQDQRGADVTGLLRNTRRRARVKEREQCLSFISC